jgi:hypothetical protein
VGGDGFVTDLRSTLKWLAKAIALGVFSMPLLACGDGGAPEMVKIASELWLIT